MNFRTLSERNKVMNLPYAYANINNSPHFALKYAWILVGHRPRSEQIMSKDKYPSMFSCQMEDIVFVLIQIFSQHEQFGKLGNITRI